MPAVYSNTNFRNAALNGIFNTSGAGMLEAYALCAGVQPADPTTNISASDLISSSSVFLPSLYNHVSAGVSALAAPIVVTNNQASARVPSFLRILSATGYAPSSSSSSYGVADLPVGLAGSGAPCIIESLASIPVGGTVRIMNLTISTPRSSNTLRLNTNLVNAITRYVLLGDYSGSTYALYLGYNPSSPYWKIELFAGAIPDSADDAAGAVISTYTSTSSQSLMASSINGSVGLLIPLATTPTTGATLTYFRLTKTMNYGGVGVLQGTVGVMGSGADMILSTTTAVNAVPLTILSMVISI